jgi:hypothetical protein
MIVWGGQPDWRSLDAARYSPATDHWEPINLITPIATGQAFWTGSDVMLLGGFAPLGSEDGYFYNPGGDSWTPFPSPVSAGGPDRPPRYGGPATWTGTELLCWVKGSLWSYDPTTDAWTQVAEAPPGEVIGIGERMLSQPPMWADCELLVWGGLRGRLPVSTGWRYTPDGSSQEACAVRSLQPAPDRKPTSNTEL